MLENVHSAFAINFLHVLAFSDALRSYVNNVFSDKQQSTMQGAEHLHPLFPTVSFILLRSVVLEQALEHQCCHR